MKKIFLAALLVLLVVSIPSITQPEEETTLKPHDPIYINGNEEFTAENGVVSGSGTEEDPYIIEGWEIIGGDFGIAIANTDAYFTIRNCKVREVVKWDGIALDNVRNGRIENCIVQKVLRQNGIALNDSHNCTLANNLVENSQLDVIALFTSDNNILQGNTVRSDSQWQYLCGIKLYGSSNNLLHNNTSTGNRVGIVVRDLNGYGVDSIGNILLRNSSYDNDIDGIRLFQAKKTTVSGNTTMNNGEDGIRVAKSEDSILSNNVVESNEHGISLHGSTGSLIVKNDMVRNALGIAFWESSGNIFHHNNIIHNKKDVSGSATSQNQWDDGSEGNYWDDYSGWDGNGDGISDTPYRIGEGSVDRYPLMHPWKPSVVAIGIKFTGTDEFVTVRNWSEEDIDLTEWQLKSVDLETEEVVYAFLFPVGCQLPANGKIRVHSGPAATGRENNPCGSPEMDLYQSWNDLEDGGYVWDDLEGIVQLINDEGEVADEYKYHWWMGG